MVPKKMNCYVFVDPLTFDPAPQQGQNFSFFVKYQ